MTMISCFVTGFLLAVAFASTGSAFTPLMQPNTVALTPLHATWSDSKAVKEYQDFLSTGKSEIEKLPDGPSVIVKPADGDDSMATALVQLGMGDDVVLTPGEELPDTLKGEYPIYITVPPTQLKKFLENLPDSFYDRMADFVFISGSLKYGNIEDLLKTKGYCRDSMTQFLCSGLKLSPVRPQDQSINLGLDAQGEEKWAGECVACGKWSGSIEARLERGAIRCKAAFYREWRRLMWEANILDTVFHLVGAVRKEETTLADVALYYGEEVSDILWQISGVLRGWKALTLTYGFEQRLFGVAEQTGEERDCTVLENMYPFLYKPYERASKFLEYLHYGQAECGMFQTVELQPRKVSDSKPLIREGNLRADGVV